MFLTFLMLLLLIVLFLSCAALVGFTEYVISAQGRRGAGNGV
jgi:hypothetical protein